jgi:steroid 5-alpha reductase family enzyme
VFIQDKKNRGKWIASGLWKYSRHPNYFGEILVWIGIYVFVFSSLIGFERLYALASPLFITFLLVFVSGLPQLEKGADKKWGHLKAYREYKRRTSTLILWFK